MLIVIKLIYDINDSIIYQWVFCELVKMSTGVNIKYNSNSALHHVQYVLIIIHDSIAKQTRDIDTMLF